MKRPIVLYAPPGYIEATTEVRRLAVNGCGPGGWKIDVIPDTLWGLDITEACNIHDWMYTAGSTIDDKDEADRVFLNNMIRIVNAGTHCWPLLPLRRRAARIYYEFVSHFGGPAFWSGKNSVDTMHTVRLAEEAV